MLVQVPKCDICGKLKGVGNLWMLAFVHRPVRELGRCQLAVFDWHDKLAYKKGAKHICGEACLTTLMGRAVEHRKRRTMVSVERGAGEKLA